MTPRGTRSAGAPPFTRQLALLVSRAFRTPLWVWTRQAQLQLTEIRDFIAQDNPTAAVGHVRRIIHRTKAVTLFPAMGREVPELPGTGLREHIEGNYRIVYRVRQGTVQVLTVFEAHHLLPREDLSPASKT